MPKTDRLPDLKTQEQIDREMEAVSPLTMMVLTIMAVILLAMATSIILRNLSPSTPATVPTSPTIPAGPTTQIMRG